VRRARAAARALGPLGFTTLERLNAACSRVGHHTFFEPARFEWIPAVESRTAAIRAELDRLLAEEPLPSFQDISPDQRALTTDDRWKTFVFGGYGHRNERNRSRCPETAAALDLIPGLTTAMFSVLEPRKRLPPHRGPYNGVLRYHLGLKVPGDGSGCGIRVGGEVRHWVEGRSLVFDDSWTHDAWNDTDETRVVLFVDFVRPVRWPASRLNRWFIRRMGGSFPVMLAKKRLEAWNRRLDAAVGFGS
jgi:aspartyl/asparaginyl beta-hydroxylase (cupin superfamily)